MSFPPIAAASGISHRIDVAIEPGQGLIRVADEVSFSDPRRTFEFVLNKGLTVTTTHGRVESLRDSADGLRTAYRITMETPARGLKLQYHGKPVFSGQRSLGGMPQGIVSDDAVYLDGASAWFPLSDTQLGRVRLSVSLPAGWRSVSIGRLLEQDGQTVWASDQPHDDLYLIADRFRRYAHRHGDIDLSVWLLSDDAELAEHYLGLMAVYLDHYTRLIGSYPYAKFAVVENRWQTGFGMPSFTLLGSRVLRLPFIPYTSLPHEILHNWWGNGVWVDYANGNWSEGLTAYLADHWMQEREGKSDQYRLKALQRYSNFAAQGSDQPLLQFVSRHNDASQSIGYSKSLMLFHMLRSALGDAHFVAGLRRLWKQHRYQRIGFVSAVQAIAGPNAALAQQLVAWLARPGAPRLQLAQTEVDRTDGGWRLRVGVVQRQAQPFAFDLPIAITVDGQSAALREVVRMDSARHTFEFMLTQRPLRIDIDPQYDVLRHLDPTEQPPALNRLFGSPRTWLILPSAAPAAERDAWQELARAWQKRYPGMRPIDDSAAVKLAAGEDRILLGWDNALLAPIRALFGHDRQQLAERSLLVDDQSYPADQASSVLVSNDARGVTTGFIGASSPEVIAALARKLPHYGSYGRLVFDAAGKNLRRDALTSRHSTLSRQLGERQVALNLAPRATLAADDGGR